MSVPQIEEIIDERRGCAPDVDKRGVKSETYASNAFKRHIQSFRKTGPSMGCPSQIHFWHGRQIIDTIAISAGHSTD